MARVKTQFINKTIHLHVHHSSLTEPHQRHQLIATLKHLFGLSMDKVSSQLNDAFSKAGLNIEFPKKSAHSDYIQNHAVKPAFDQLHNHIDIHLAINQRKIEEDYPFRPLAVRPLQKSKKDKAHNKKIEEQRVIAEKLASAYTHVQVTFTVKSTLFPLWYELNRNYISKVNQLINDDKKYEEECLQLMLQTLQTHMPENEQHLFEPTKRWYRKNVSKNSVVPRPKNKPFHAVLLTTMPKGKTAEDDTIGITLLLKPYDHMGYIPCKLHVRKNLFFDASDLKESGYTYTLGIKKEGKCCTVYILFTNSDGQHSSYAMKLKQDIKQSKTPFGNKPIFEASYMWNENLPDKDYVIIKDAPLSETLVDVVSNKGGVDARSVEFTMHQFNERLSLFDLQQQKELMIREVINGDDIPEVELVDI